MSEHLMVCKALAAMIRQHGEPTEEEVNFIAHAAFELALSPDQNQQVQRVLAEGGEYQQLVQGVTSKPMRTYLFRRVVAAALIDEKLEEAELAIIKLTANTFGFKTEGVDQYVSWMKEGIAWEKRGVELLSRL